MEEKKKELLEYLNSHCDENDLYGPMEEILDILDIHFNEETKTFE